MEGAKAKQIGAGTAEIDILPHNLLNGIAGCQLFQNDGGNAMIPLLSLEVLYHITPEYSTPPGRKSL